MLAQSCLWAKNYPCALEQFQTLLQQSPDSAGTHVLTGEALDGLGRTAEAITEFQAAAKIAPSEPNVHFGLGYLYWKSQQYDQARPEFERELALDPNHAQALAYLGDIEWKNNHPEAALPLLKRSLEAQKNLRSSTSISAQSTCSRKITKMQRQRCFTPLLSIPASPIRTINWAACTRPSANPRTRRGNSAKFRNCTRKRKTAW